MKIDNKSGNNLEFSKEMLSDCLHIWGKASISLIDIRHSTLFSDEYIRTHRISANTFFFTMGTQAEVCIDDTFYSVDRFGVFHGGKGSEITIRPIQDYLECYMLLYKTSEPLLRRNEYMKLLEKTNPFRQQYGFAPENPLFFMEHLQKMLEAWKKSSALSLFYSKSALYQFVYEVYYELMHGDVQTFQPDMVETIKRYMGKHYGEPLSIQTIANIFGISASQLSRVFKKREGQSPQEFLIATRLQAVMGYLSSTEATVREIALACGFSDEFSLSKQFRSHFSMTPSEYRKISTSQMHDFAMFKDLPFSYNKIDRVSLGKLKGEGANTYMFKQFRNKAIVAAALALVMMMSACGTAPTDNTVSTITPTASVTSQGQEETSTRIISTVMGDVEVPANPQRVIVNFYMGDVIAFDVPLAGTRNVSEDATFYSHIENLKKIEAWEQEDLLALQPDLIIDGNEKSFEKFSSIAPVIIIPWDVPMEERIEMLGQVFGKEDMAKQLLTDYNEKAAAAKAELEAAGILDHTISILDGSDAMVSTFGLNNGRGTEIIYDDFQMSVSPRIQTDVIDAGLRLFDFSLEVLPEYAGDIILNVINENGTGDLSDTPIWSTVPAVIEGNVVEVSHSLFFYNDIISRSYQLEVLTEELLNLPIAKN